MDAPGHRAAGRLPGGPWLQGGQLSPVPRSLGLRRDPRAAPRGRAGRCPRARRLRGRGPGAGAGDAEVPGGWLDKRSSRRAKLGPSAWPVLPGATTRAYRRQVCPGRRTLLSPPAGHLLAAGGGLEPGGLAGGVSVQLHLAPKLAGTPRAERAPSFWRPPSLSLNPDQCGVPRTSSPVVRGVGGTGGGVGTTARGASSAASLPSSRHRQEWVAPWRPASAMEERAPIPPFCALGSLFPGHPSSFRVRE